MIFSLGGRDKRTYLKRRVQITVLSYSQFFALACG